MKDNIFNNWLDEILKTEKPNVDIIAYYFGILETTNGYQTYLIGSKEFDEEDDDWACNADFVPMNKYLAIGQLGTNWELILADVKQHIENFMQTSNFKNSFLEKAKAIAMGFDDGDLHRVR